MLTASTSSRLSSRNRVDKPALTGHQSHAAAGTAKLQSDVDLLVIGRPDGVALSERLAPGERAVGRDVTVVTKSGEQVPDRHRKDDPFWRQVLRRLMVHVLGCEISLSTRSVANRDVDTFIPSSSADNLSIFRDGSSSQHVQLNPLNLSRVERPTNRAQHRSIGRLTHQRCPCVPISDALAHRR